MQTERSSGGRDLRSGLAALCSLRPRASPRCLASRNHRSFKLDLGATFRDRFRRHFRSRVSHAPQNPPCASACRQASLVAPFLDSLPTHPTRDTTRRDRGSLRHRELVGSVFVAYPAPIAGSKPPTPPVNPTPRLRGCPADSIAAIVPADSSSRSAPAFDPPNRSSDPADTPSERPGVDAVTIVFRDGRPRQQIRNYILTRKTLFIGDDNQPAIPVEQLDLIATIKANEEAGVTFQLPPSIQ